MEEQGQDFDPIAGALGLLEQLLMPAWADLIALVPWLFLGLLALALLGLAVAWRRAGARTRSRVARPLAAGAPPPGVHLPGPSRWPFVAPIGVAIVLLALILPQRDEAGTVTLPFSPLLMLAGLAIAGLSIVGWLLDAMREWRSTERGHAAAGQPALEGGAAPALAAGETAVAVRELPAEPPPG
ncbi:MAG TPA: hypothetical protein VNW68_01965, partial [Candidatus Limnocylindria bacterium]|nr:hypothetical protein [Candidatus Limnocylindria bacterium]